MSDFSANGNGSILDRLPPQNPEIEMCVIGAMMLDPGLIDEIAAILRPEDFYSDSHIIIVRVIFSLHGEGKPVDSLTVEDELTRAGDLERVGGIAFVLECLEKVPHTGYAIYHAAVVKSLARKRSMIEICNTTLRDAYSPAMEDSELYQSHESRVFAAMMEVQVSEPADGQVVVGDYIDMLARRKAGEVDPGIRTGFMDLDDPLGGWEGNQLIVIGARPSMGKTALALQIATQIGEIHGIPSLFISLEMGESELAGRLLCIRSGVPYELFRRPATLKASHFERLTEAHAKLARLPPVLIDTSANISADRVASTCRRMRTKKGIGIVFVDYMQLLQPENRRDSREQQVASISMRLKGVARELDIPVVMISQLNRAVENRDLRRPRLADLRDSGQIEQDAHQVLFLHRPEYYDANDKPGMAEIIIAKNRNGPTDSRWLQFDKPIMRFADLAFPEGPAF